jgi:two-component system, NarL family, nitrate/nitrite response regulator NarL
MSLPPPPSVRVLIVDDHEIMRAGLRMLLESQPGFTVVGEASTCADTLALALDTQPDVIVLDLDLGGENAVESIPMLLRTAPDTRILVLTGVRDPEVHRHAIRQGAVGLVLKEQAVETLLQAITQVRAGEVWLEPTMIARVLGDLTRPQAPPQTSAEATKIARLTEREREVITLVGEGLRNKHIAERLSISEATVRHHLTGIFAKLDVADRFELAIYAYQHELAKLPTSRLSPGDP